MQITLTPELAHLVKQRVEAGDYESPDAMVQEALELLEQRDTKLAALKQDVQHGLEQLEGGEYTEYTDETLPQLFDRVSQRGRQMLDAEKSRRTR